MKAVYRVSYYFGGQPKQSFVCAASEGEASAFLGVRDGSASVSTVASDVEVAGVDKPHAVIPSMPITYAPPEAAKPLSDAELAKLRALLAKS